MHQFSFEKLEVWRLGQTMVEMIYSDTYSFPKHENYGIISQLRRSAVSVCSNIAEGSGKVSNKDKKRYVSIAYGSLMETMNLVILSNRLKYVKNEKLKEYRQLIRRISIMLTRLGKYFESNPT